MPYFRQQERVMVLWDFVYVTSNIGPWHLHFSPKSTVCVPGWLENDQTKYIIERLTISHNLFRKTKTCCQTILPPGNFHKIQPKRNFSSPKKGSTSLGNLNFFKSNRSLDMAVLIICDFLTLPLYAHTWNIFEVRSHFWPFWIDVMVIVNFFMFLYILGTHQQILTLTFW